MKIVTVSQMQAIEKAADQAGISYQQMMENAGQGVAAWVIENYPAIGSVIGLIGSGNNGGDTLIAITALAKIGIRTLAFTLKKREEDGLIKRYLSVGGSLIDISEGENLDIYQAALIPGTLVLDGILGTGLKLPLRGALKDVMGNVFQLTEKHIGVLLVAVDCPSGVDCDTGESSDVTLTAHHTLTMAAIKQGLLFYPARGKAGQIHRIDIGICEISKYTTAQLPEMIEKDLVKKALPSRPAIAHKGTFGTCLTIAGTQSYTGAAYLAGKAAYRAGCGLVHMAVHKSVHASLAGEFVEAVWTLLADKNGHYEINSLSVLKDTLQKVDSMIIGPGWGLHDDNAVFLQDLLQEVPKDLPTIFDADGLKLLSHLPLWWQLIPKKSILTPHPGEMGILTGMGTGEIQANRWDTARTYAEKWKVTLILKGAETVIADQDGNLWINPVSEPTLATAGSGDVLSGLIGGFLAQGMSPQNAAVTATWIHAQAGILAKCRVGNDRSVTALDILDRLPEALTAVC